jgi:hypothetical protein
MGVDGGYKECSINIGGNKDTAESWLYDNIGAHIEVYNPGMVKVWEGFVNEVSITLGGLVLTRGPMTAIANRATAKYQTPSYNFPAAGITIGGDQAITGEVNDTTSHDLYGIRPKYLSVGTASSTEALQIVSTYLSENAYPQIKQDIAIGGEGGNISIQVKCQGYKALLDYYPFNIGAGTGQMNLSTKLEETLAQDPDSIFSTDYSFIETNTTQVQKYYEADRTAEAVIKGLVALGGPLPNFDRYIWGIYNDLILHYEAIPTDYEYIHQIADNAQRVLTVAGAVVDFWDVRAGKYLLVSDTLVGRPIPSTLREDPRMLFIESVTYTAPDSLKLQGGRTDTISQKLARLNLGGL